MTIFGAAIAAIMIVYVGILFLLARGEADKVAEARNALLWGIVGVAIIFGSNCNSKLGKNLINIVLTRKGNEFGGGFGAAK